ncbi:hypothetical protein CDO73_26235 [Saccharibacillus sp. O23]|uniref:helix-turn-helix transcriptional regulator n=1 Tax=Saccharibacillus sp. O23 TaxID=2009338 RepID=UPI000B4E0654|nr:hypothetical protein [Saccharibacillus sp. O23]OWR25679.1 hypothetical protein CDO73_26235 [Saccharibacillus sp. O23]
MRSVKLKQTAGENTVILTIQDPKASPGWSRNWHKKQDGTLTIQITEVPDGVTDGQVLHLYNQTGVYHRPDSDYIVRFSDLEPGRIVQVGPSANRDGGLVNSTEAAAIIGITRQAVYRQHLASSKEKYRGQFPRAVKTDPGGGSPWFDREAIEVYAAARAKKNKQEREANEADHENL